MSLLPSGSRSAMSSVPERAADHQAHHRAHPPQPCQEQAGGNAACQGLLKVVSGRGSPAPAGGSGPGSRAARRAAARSAASCSRASEDGPAPAWLSAMLAASAAASSGSSSKASVAAAASTPLGPAVLHLLLKAATHRHPDHLAYSPTPYPQIGYELQPRCPSLCGCS